MRFWAILVFLRFWAFVSLKFLSFSALFLLLKQNANFFAKDCKFKVLIPFFSENWQHLTAHNFFLINFYIITPLAKKNHNFTRYQNMMGCYQSLGDLRSYAWFLKKITNDWEHLVISKRMPLHGHNNSFGIAFPTEQPVALWWNLFFCLLMNRILLSLV